MDNKAISLWRWIISNSWNLFSMLGVLATIYFGFFYIPSYAKENLYSKSELAKEEIVYEIGVRLYAKEDVSISDIEKTIEQKEVYYKINFPFSTRQTLLLVSNDFSKNHYIELEKKSLIAQHINYLIDSIEKLPVSEDDSYNINYIMIISSIITSLLALVGAASIRQKVKKDAEVEIELDEENILFEEGTVSRRGIEYSLMVKEVLEEMGVKINHHHIATPQQPVYGPEFDISTENGDLLIETKAYSKKVGISTMRGFLNYLKRNDKPGVLISTSGLTIRAKQLLTEHNDRYESAAAIFVMAVTRGDVKYNLISTLGAEVTAR